MSVSPPVVTYRGGPNISISPDQIFAFLQYLVRGARIFRGTKYHMTEPSWNGCCCLGKREESWEGRPRGRCMVDNVHNIQLRIIIKLPVNPNITIFFSFTTAGFRSLSKISSLIKPKSKTHGFYEALHAGL